eukprot:5648276-Pyramimonas_sp.AAC.1
MSGSAKADAEPAHHSEPHPWTKPSPNTIVSAAGPFRAAPPGRRDALPRPPLNSKVVDAMT